MRHLIIFKVNDSWSDETQHEQRTIIDADSEDLAIQEFVQSMTDESYEILNVMELTW